MTFLDNLQRGLNVTTTENGAVTNKSSLDPVVDFFGLAGAMRSTPDRAVKLFEAAYAEDPLTAVRTLFYLRDVRGGQGERDVFRACFAHLGNLDPGAAAKVFGLIPEYGRWDDILNVECMGDAVELISRQLMHDMFDLGRGKSISLLAKWLPSENTSSPKTRALAFQIRTRLGMSSREYRRTLSSLRGHIRLLEQDMSTSNWKGIEHGKLPSQAHRRHVKAFHRHTPDEYQAYLDSVSRGEKKINVKAVYPHEIYNMVSRGETAYSNVAWDNLPDYTDGKNALVMADVSQSMVQSHKPNNPIAVSVSLALYFAERNKGAFKDHFMTFSDQPSLVKIAGSTLAQKMQSIQRVGYLSMNTNLLAAFRAILQAGLSAPAEIPSVLYIISDMEFDAAQPTGTSYTYQQIAVQTPFGVRIQQVRAPVIGTSHDTIFETAKREFAQHGLTLPHVVFWNVDARQNQAPALSDDGHVSLVSGLSPTIFSQAVQGKTPRELVDEVVNAERYQRIVL